MASSNSFHHVISLSNSADTVAQKDEDSAKVDALNILVVADIDICRDGFE